MSASARKPKTSKRVSGPLGRILVVDDDRDFAESLANLLELRGYEAKAKYDSRGALALAKTFEPDVALVDIRLGRESGLNLVTDLKERHPGIDCILITAHAELDTAIEAVWRGAYDYLLKPLDDNDLMISLDRCFEKRRLEREKQVAEAALARSEERYRDFTEAASDWAWETDTEQRFTRIVGLSAKETGIAGEDLVGKTPMEIGVRGIDEEATARQLQAFKECRPFRGSVSTILARDGRVRYINVSGKPIFDADKYFFGYRGTATDITESKNREDELEKARADLRIVLENVGQGISMTDANMVNTVFNDKFLELLDFPKGKFKPGDAFEKFIRFNAERGEYGGGDIEQMVRDRVEIAKKFAPHQFERIRPDGQVLEIRGKPVPGGGGFVTTYTDVTERKQAEAALLESDERIRSILENVADGVITVDEKGKIESFNPAAEAMFGYTAEEMVGRAVSNLTTGKDRTQHKSYMRNYLETGEGKILGVGGRELKARRKDGSIFPMELTVSEMWVGDRRLFIGAVRDIAARRQIEEQLRQAQKMEAVGQLTGGIAHDFNNILGIILGNLELAKDKTPIDGEVARRLDTSIGATKRAAALVAQLLAFARKQTLTPTATDAVSLIAGMQNMLQRALGEVIKVEVTHSRDCWPALVDPAQLESAVLNLAINARDAMRKGGKLAIEITNAVVKSGQSDIPLDVTPGRYLSIKVEDTGSGMAPEVLEHAFDPFYTTKEVGEGSGLGLSMTYGFVKQSNGYVWIDSEEGRGTAVTIYLPRAEGEPGRAAQVESPIAAPSVSGKTILVVEDDGDLRHLVTTMLDNLGYETMSAGTAKKALKLLKHSPKTDLLLSDVVLAGGMSGRELARLALQQNPTLSILFMSGYPDRDFDMDSGVGERARILGKPFRKDDLARAVLDAIEVQGSG